MESVSDSGALVELRKISKHFGEGDTRVDALREVSISVFPGEIVGLVGPSGSGKSTLLNVIACILEPSSGWMRLDQDVVYDNRWLKSDLRKLRLDKIGFIFQFHNLLPFLNTTENVAMVLELSGASTSEAKAASHRIAGLSRRRQPQKRNARNRFGRGGTARVHRPRAWPTALGSYLLTSPRRHWIRSAPAR